MSQDNRRQGQDGYGGSANVNGYGDYDGNRRNGGKRKRTFGDFLSMLLMLVALAVFCYSGYMLYTFYREYKKGSDEYDNLEAQYTVVQDEEEDSENVDIAVTLEQLEELQEQEELKKSGAQESESEEDDPVQHIQGIKTMATITVDGEKRTLPVMNNPIDFEELESINTDICGWLRIRALDISYPLVQAEDNDYYLHRTFEKEDNFAGCLFLNYSNANDFSDTNTVIYGHNMKNGSMFGKLKQFNDEDVFNKSKYFWIFTKDYIYQYRIFSAMVVNKTGLTYQTSFQDDEYQEFLEIAFENSVVDNTGIEVTEDDQVVTLSTCTGDESTRFVVIGKLVKTYLSKQSELNQQ